MRTKVHHHHHHHYHFGMVVTNLKKDHVEYLQDIPDLQNHLVDKSIIKSHHFFYQQSGRKLPWSPGLLGNRMPFILEVTKVSLGTVRFGSVNSFCLGISIGQSTSWKETATPLPVVVVVKPIWKVFVNSIIFPKFRGERLKYVWNYQLLEDEIFLFNACPGMLSPNLSSLNFMLQNAPYIFSFILQTRSQTLRIFWRSGSDAHLFVASA